MPQIGSFVTLLYREESRTTGELIAAVCKAQLEFAPITLDCEGRRGGEAYRYASIQSIRRGIQHAMSRHGLLIHHVYGFSDQGEHVVTVLRHSSGEYIASTSRIAFREDAQEQKALKTLLCRTAIEGLLGIVTEEDDDAQSTTIEVDSANVKQQASNLAMAKAAILSAGSPAALERYAELAKTRLAEGALSVDGAAEIERLIEERKKHHKKEVASADGKGTAGDQGTDAARSGSVSSDSRVAGRAAGVGRGDAPAGVKRDAQPA